MKKILFVIIPMILVLLPVFSFALTAHAQSEADVMLWGGLEGNVQATTGLGNTDPREMAARVVNIMLGFIGIIAVIIILLGGFKWMTAAGNEDQISSGNKIMGAGLVGLVIVLAAYAIAAFVVNQLTDATGYNQ